MRRIPLTKDEFMMVAMRAYDPSCISLTEFRIDLRNLRKIKKDLSILISDSPCKRDINVRCLLNRFLIAYNQFGQTATELIFFFMNEEERKVAAMFMVKLGRRDDLVDKYQLNINASIFAELSKI